MRYCHNDNFVPFNCINDREWKSPRQNAAKTICDFLAKFRPLTDGINGVLHVVEEDCARPAFASS
jgi:hypothetical protein